MLETHTIDNVDPTVQLIVLYNLLSILAVAPQLIKTGGKVLEVMS